MTLGVLLSLLLAIATAGVAQENPGRSSLRPGNQDSAALAKGRQTYQARCATCHGLDGRGGEHARGIANSRAVQGRSDQKLAEIVREGIPSAGMPSFRFLRDSEISALVKYLRSLGGPRTSESAGEEKAASPISVNIDIAPERLLVAPPRDDWPSYNGDYSGRRYSALDQINPGNVEHLRAQWVFHSTNSESMEVTPVVVAGITYITSGNDAFALDARTGRVLWHHARALSEGLIDDAAAHHNRGVAIWHTRAYMETDNAHLLCLDARSGHLIWDVPYADTRLNYGATSAPLLVNGKVLVGTSGGDDGVRGFLAAFDAVTGKLAWRFWTIPTPGEPGSQSWKGDAYLHGGGTTWMPGTFDPQSNTVYWGTSNPAPDFVGDTRPGDDLYTDCVLALDADTGKLKWYFQFTPHDLFDYDATETPVLLDATVDGQERHLLVEANRNGFYYILDRTNGKFLGATRFVEKLNWATGIDENGRPLLTGLKPTPQGARICPSLTGATNWFSPSYNPSTGLFYFQALEDCDMYFASRQKQIYRPGQTYYSTGTKRIRGEPGQKILLALDVATGKPVWRYPQAGEGDSWGGTMTTAGGLVFFGDDAGEFEAVDATTGKPLWHFNTGQRMHASPMSYAADGVQYVCIAVGSDVFSFALDVKER